MSTIASLTVWLRAKTAAFDRAMHGSGKRVSGFSQAVSRANRIMGTFGIALGGYAAVNFLKGSVEEKAVRRLGDALDLLGKRGELKGMEDWARSIQKITTIGDEAVLEMAALGASLGKLSGQALQDATRAAIGLSRAVGVDTTAAMRLVARAAIGDTAQLTRYGIKLNELLSPQEKFNELLAIGAKNFNIATGEAATMTGQIEQLKNQWGDLREKIGEFTMKGAVGAGWMTGILTPPAETGFWTAVEKEQDRWKRYNQQMEQLRTAESKWSRTVGVEAELGNLRTRLALQERLAETAREMMQTGPDLAARQRAMEMVNQHEADAIKLREQVIEIEERLAEAVKKREEAERQAAQRSEEIARRDKALADQEAVREKARLAEIERRAAEGLAIIEERWARMASEADAIFQATRTPLEIYEQTIERLNELLEDGRLSWETYGRAVRDAILQRDAASKPRPGEFRTVDTGLMDIRGLRPTATPGRTAVDRLNEQQLVELKQLVVIARKQLEKKGL